MCLFGEHQDYLHLPVVPCAISLRVTIEGRAWNSHRWILTFPTSVGILFPIDCILPYEKESGTTCGAP